MLTASQLNSTRYSTGKKFREVNLGYRKLDTKYITQAYFPDEKSQCDIREDWYRKRIIRFGSGNYWGGTSFPRWMMDDTCPTNLWRVMFDTDFVGFFQDLSVTVSVLTLTFISVDRWYAVCSPLKFASSTRRAVKSIAVIWTVSSVSGEPLTPPCSFQALK